MAKYYRNHHYHHNHHHLNYYQLSSVANIIVADKSCAVSVRIIVDTFSWL